MTWWQSNALGSAPFSVRANGEAIIRCLSHLRAHRFPVLRGVSLPADGFYEEYLFDLGLGLTMPVAREAGSLDPAFPDEAAMRAIAASKLGHQIAPQAEVMAASIRRLVAKAQTEGMPVRTLGVDLAEYGYWTDPDEPLFHIGIHTLGHNLAPATHWLLVSSSDELEQAFAGAMTTLRNRWNLLAALGSQGADGTIDELALHAVERQPCPRGALRALRDVHQLELQDGTLLMWTRGHVSSGDGGDLPGISWTHNLVTLHDVQLPVVSLIGAIGKPITQLVEHASLSEKMIIEAADNCHDGESHSVNVRVLLPRYLIDTAVGRVICQV